MEQQISNLVMAGWIFNMVIGVGLPVGLAIFIKKKNRMRIGAFFTGACANIIISMCVQPIIAAIVFNSSFTRDFFTENGFVMVVVQAVLDSVLMAGGYLLIMKFLLKDFNLYQNALLFGVGAGAVKSIFTIAMQSFVSFVNCQTINLQGVDELLSYYEGEDLEYFRAQCEAMISATPLDVWGIGFVNIFAIIMQIAISVLVFLAIKREGKMYYFPTAIAMMGVSQGVQYGYATGFIRLGVFLILLAVIVLASGFFACRLCMTDTGNERGRGDIIIEKRAYQSGGSAAGVKERSMKEKIAEVSRANRSGADSADGETEECEDSGSAE